MPVRVELIDDAVDDLLRYAESGNLPLFLKKLLRLEDVGAEAGQPLGGGLTGWRKIVVGDRNWRIIFTTDVEETVATVWVIGDRDDSVCYAEAQRRVAALGKGHPGAATLASVMFQLSEMQRAAKKTKRRRRR
jgi:mRNA interferase RelE/StbE